MAGATVYILSPANSAGKRAAMLMSPCAEFDLAVRLRSKHGAPIGELFAFMSGLYFRGKLAYARRFADPPRGWEGGQVITPGFGLVGADTPITLRDLRRIARVRVDPTDPEYIRPFKRDVNALASVLSESSRAVLLGSVATPKYVEPLLESLDDRLHFPQEFIGRGDMSRGGLMLRAADSGARLSYIRARSAPRRGTRPPKLAPRKAGIRAS